LLEAVKELSEKDINEEDEELLEESSGISVFFPAKMLGQIMLSTS
jgi:hypothetical protein